MSATAAATDRHRLGPAGWLALAVGPLGWALTQQVSYLLASFGCAFGRPGVVLAINGMGALTALAGAGFCWRARHRAPAPEESRAERGFLAGLGVLLGLVFALAMLGQGAAALFFTGCEG
jgi:hypothetical protein